MYIIDKARVKPAFVFLLLFLLLPSTYFSLGTQPGSGQKCFSSPPPGYNYQDTQPCLGEPDFEGKFMVYNYKDNTVWTVSQPVDPEMYYALKNNPISNEPVCIKCKVDATENEIDMNIEHSKKVLKNVLGTWPMVTPLASQLRAISGSDDELFANLVLQVVHHLTFVTTTNGKFPLVTIAEREGDCDNLATLAAAIMKAGGLDSMVMVGPVPSGNCFDPNLPGHAMMGVHLSVPPDFETYASRHINPDPNYPNYITDANSEEYYLGEPTWFRKAKPPILTEQDYNYYAATNGSLIGENPISVDAANRYLEVIAESPVEMFNDVQGTTPGSCSSEAFSCDRQLKNPANNIRVD